MVVRKVDDFFLVLNPDIPNIMVMDETGKRFFELCNGDLTVNDVVKRFLKNEKVRFQETNCLYLSLLCLTRTFFS